MVSICLVTRNAGAVLRDCLRSLFEGATYSPMEVTVVDNASADGTLAMLRDEFPAVRAIRNAGNDGFAKPMNMALRAASGEYLLVLNNDTILQPGLVPELLRCLRENPRAGIAGPKVLNQDGTFQKQCKRSYGRPVDLVWYLSGLARLFPRHPRLARYLMGHLPEDASARVEAVSGSCMLVRRAVFEQIGYFDEQFFAYQEDSDFCMRAAKAGWEVWYWPPARIIHLGGMGGSHTDPWRSILEWHRSYILYYRKHFAPESPTVINGVLYIIMGVKLGLAAVQHLLAGRRGRTDSRRS